MIIPEGLMHRRINIFTALVIILIIAAMAALAISVEAARGIGLRVIAPIVKCVPDPQTVGSTCLDSCMVCGDLPGCSGMFEVRAKYLGGVNLLYKGQALCVNSPTPPKGGTFRPGNMCLGIVGGVGPHKLVNFACTK